MQDTLENAAGCKVGGAVGNMLGDKVGHNVRDKVRDAVENRAVNKARDKVEDKGGIRWEIQRGTELQASRNPAYMRREGEAVMPPQLLEIETQRLSAVGSKGAGEEPDACIGTPRDT